jgi:acetoacetate decarboxylase
MQYRRSDEDVRRFLRSGPVIARLDDSEVLWMIARTDADLVASLLPSPLQVPREPLAYAFVTHYRKPNFTGPYREGALFVAAEYRRQSGWYCLAMPADDDTAVASGREIQGFPKKMSDRISLEHDEVAGGHVVGSVTRKGVEILRIEGDYAQPVAEAELPLAGKGVDLDGRVSYAAASLLFKHTISASGSGLAHLPQLVRQVTLFTPRPGQRIGSATLQLRSTPTDDLGVVPVGQIVHTGFGTFDVTMLPGRRLRRIYNVGRFIPYALFKNDAYSLVDPSSLPDLNLGERRATARRLAKY